MWFPLNLCRTGTDGLLGFHVRCRQDHWEVPADGGAAHRGRALTSVQGLLHLLAPPWDQLGARERERERRVVCVSPHLTLTAPLMMLQINTELAGRYEATHCRVYQLYRETCIAAVFYVTDRLHG